MTKQNNTLPKGWKFWILDDAVLKWSSNISLNKIEDESWDYPIFKAKGIHKNISFYHQENEYLAIIKDWAGIWRVWRYPAKSSVVWTMQYLIPRKWFEINFIWYFLLWIDFEEYRTWSTIPHIYYKNYKNASFPLVDNSEQKRIVKILDELFENIDEAKKIAEDNLVNAKKVFESYLQNIFEKKWDDWEEKELKKITSKIWSGATPRWWQANYKEEGISLIRSMNVHDFQFKEKKLAFIDQKQADWLSNVVVQEKDVLLNITWASIARCCMVPKYILPWRVNQHVSIIRADQTIINSVFLSSLLTSKYFKDKILKIWEQWATRQAITKVQLENFVVSFPKSLEKQKEVVKILDELSYEVKGLEKIYKEKIEKLEELKKSVLQEAFSGKL